ncbi:hypothetical protein QBC33DRAFT_167109 [Phialemonium atrogriseum]|uniref:Uncharacterized protein n=1 Tax=Phialemonium atrogriseum TaxID=1093897 RepID=A0AAJ0FQX9_9PEZI|nr:uncharacterized protein QBC33DRAFT_167109 [Phialemonium atrogriseum]KAK1771779.1 hypothetical protein QBC33DRAFT_167109 [Phialemonium atrogriseum]
MILAKVAPQFRFLFSPYFLCFLCVNVEPGVYVVATTLSLITPRLEAGVFGPVFTFPPPFFFVVLPWLYGSQSGLWC